jgi:hypothetical protein
MEPEGSLPFSHKYATDPYPESHESSLHPLKPTFHKIHYNVNSHLCPGFLVVPSSEGWYVKHLHHDRFSYATYESQAATNIKQKSTTVLIDSGEEYLHQTST